jgi:hypothetical protein
MPIVRTARAAAEVRFSTPFGEAPVQWVLNHCCPKHTSALEVSISVCGGRERAKLFRVCALRESPFP